MPVFVYQAMDKSGQPVDGKLEAEHEFSAAAKLQKMGYIVLEVTEVKESTFGKTFALRRKVKIGDISFFSRQLTAMLTAGIPLTRCLYTLHEQTKNPVLQQTVGQVARDVEGGISMSEALSAHPAIFSSMYVDMVKAGEMGGMIEEMLQRLSEQLDRDKNLRDNIRSATMYPIMVIIFAICVVLAMMFFIVPIFMGFFPEDVPLPLATRIVMGISDSLRGYWYLYILTVILAVLGLRVYMSSEGGKKTLDRLKFKVPVFGDLFHKVTVARFARTLSTLLGGGIPVLQALEAAGPASGSIQVANAIKQAGASIMQGQSIAVPLKNSDLFPPMLVNMVAVGEETGQLPELLGRVADFYEEEVATMTKGLTAMIEPLLLMLIGCIVGSILIAVYLPIFTVVTSIGGK
ncbi:type II secretion system F family protein [Desulfoscipio gibsoniae]|uniref:Type II secretory pathway, component PulF n=1 Tax=Desulfoscipio gibsoniae DSM 7213 TaxID=767817 RepID=R4KKG2_9FIRM|nr:type II secretion system F family protein [Desulfoscipio gibsoniae]AGL02062.1 type II secretory pathway, component PulF [Desulfoscipio gibsoniae DSM 7213]